MAPAGFWNVEIKTPLGVRRTMIEFSVVDGQLHGISRGEVEQLTLLDLRQDGNRLVWHQNVTKPMRMVLSFDVTVDGDTMTGTARGGPMSGAKVSGSRAPTRQSS
ncbi:hypothetical protein Aca07nite_65110 [Actinoplanes capillaceus]|uniref:Uncharacterized protein n=1 Tax=Actinoplanes campanulatus TaxID=113559 RepID=A0ABQ3WSG6_9ACTN|nr:hypothetical protein [Actinoplanes capillaceus]GID49236.1 hypothetical protein Aca07nite_65110 [Actinoplanes capillaceus]